MRKTRTIETFKLLLICISAVFFLAACDDEEGGTINTSNDTSGTSGSDATDTSSSGTDSSSSGTDSSSSGTDGTSSGTDTPDTDTPDTDTPDTDTTDPDTTDPDTTDPDTSTCTDACSTGETQCTANTVEQCVADADGCLIWEAGTDCTLENRTCIVTGTQAACSTTCTDDADCDGVSTADDCDDADTNIGSNANDADCDTIPTANDCDDADPTAGSNANDADCDTIPTADDCDDSNAALGATAADADCDGSLTADDCDDNNAALGATAADTDCDGSLTADDCDDADPTLGPIANDIDCDGFVTTNDCDDADNTVGFSSADADCDGQPDITIFAKAPNTDPTDPANQDCITPLVCITRAMTNGLFNAVTETAFTWNFSPADTEWAQNHVGQSATYGDLMTVLDAGMPSWIYEPWSMHLVTDDLYFNVYPYYWAVGAWDTRLSTGEFAYGRAPAITFTKANFADPTDPANQDCLTPAVCITRGDSQSIFNAVSETGFAGSSPAGTEWAPMATRDASPADYASFSAATGSNPQSAVGQVMSVHILGTDIYYDIVFTAYSGGAGNPGGGFSYVRSRALVAGCTDPTAPNYDPTATLDDGYCGDWIRFSKADFADPTLPENQDCLSPSVCIARNDSQGLYNALIETSYNTGNNDSPLGTLWAPMPTASATLTDYSTWYDLTRGSASGNSPPSTNYQTLSVWSTADATFHDIVFLKLSAWEGGGGFVYVRQPVTVTFTCGDGTIELGELCDEGAANSDAPDATCRTNCISGGCGDTIVDSAETCDEGVANSNLPGATCRVDCTLGRCGDAIVDPTEDCDDGTNDGSYGTCNPDCSFAPYCGDNILDGGETCDEGVANSDLPDATCRTSCTPGGCGDNIVDSAEGCDDGNTTNGDGCEANCTSVCGQGSGANAAWLSPTDGACFIVFNTPTTFDNAQALCVAAGGNLATIADAAEQTLATQIRTTIGFDLWIGYNDIDTEGTFVWINGDTSTFTVWAGGEPNNVGNEDCTEVWGTDWNDISCTDAGQVALCEVP